MAKQTRPAAAHTLPNGIKLIQTLRGHSEQILSLAYSPDGRKLVSADREGAVRLWDATGSQKSILLGKHRGGVYAIAFDRAGLKLASADGLGQLKLWDATLEQQIDFIDFKGGSHSCDAISFGPDGDNVMVAQGGTVIVWDIARRLELTRHLFHQGKALRLLLSPDGKRLASTSGREDAVVKIWEVGEMKLLHTLTGHNGIIWGCAFAPNGGLLATGGEDHTVKIWDASSGKLLRTLEEHTGWIEAIAFSADGRLLASKSRDGTIRIWGCELWNSVAVIDEPNSAFSIQPALAFHPTKSVLATAGSELNAKELYRGQVINIYDIDADTLVDLKSQQRSVAKSAHHTTAKVVLVGDTGVGKSGMAERLVYGKFADTKSTHARRALFLESQKVSHGPDLTTHRDTILWDLAGQPAYRLVHQLSLDDAVVACVLFDSRSGTNPFEGAAFWAQALKFVRTRTPLVRFLVASRVDVGGLPASVERINAFTQEHGFVGFFPTSAFTGEGCFELLEAIKSAIPWDDLPVVTSSEVLAQLRNFVARLKATNAESQYKTSKNSLSLLGISELQQQFEADLGKKVLQDDFIAYLGRLEDSDDIDVLAFQTTWHAPRAEDLVLLDPTRIDAYASALLVAAKDEPDGPGHLLESRIRTGDFNLDESERLADQAQEQHVLWYVVELLLSRDLALRETIQNEEYLVFPSQCTSPLVFPGGTAFGVALGMQGHIRNIYATLIAQLAHYEGFAKREFFHEAAAYHTKTGDRCLVRLEDRGDGSGELQVSFDAATRPDVRQGFLNFVEKHVEVKANPGSVTRRHAYHCRHCDKPFDDTTVKERLDDNRQDLLCPRCEKRTPLVNLLVPPTAASTKVAETIDANAKAGRQRITAAWVIKAKEAEGKYDVFLSHNSNDKAEVEKIAKRLKSVGLRPWLDKWDLIPGETIMDALDRAIKSIPCCILFLGPGDAGDWHIIEIREYVAKWAKHNGRFIPTILPNVNDVPELPAFVGQSLWVDMREWEQKEHDGFYRLVCGVIGKRPGDSPLANFNARKVWDWQQE